MKIRATLLLFLIAACDNPARVDEIMLRIETNSLVYSQGDSLTITVTNVGSAAVNYAPCPIIAERTLGTSWRAVETLPGYEPDGCDAILIELKPRESRTVAARLDPRFGDGIYRLWLPSMRRMDHAALDRPSTVSNVFVVN